MGEIILGEMGLGEMGLGEVGQNRPRRPRNTGGAGLWGPKIMALMFITVKLTQQLCADVHCSE